jgi:molybdopterin-guanine dinucleotide biosynthesis protein A
MRAEPVWGLVLAGGRSQRMGRDKALLRRDGATQLERAVDLLGRHTERVFVSTRADQAGDTERRRFPQIVDRHADIGPVAGILSALEEHPDVTWLVLACDLPNVDDATIAFLLEQRADSQPFTAFTSSHDGLPEPLCALYRPGALPIVRSFVDAGAICPRKILIRSDTKLLEQPNPAALDNVNTPDDLARAGMK